ncbi:MAG: DUF1493 family protein [Sphingobacteriaceae bacterium]|nr:DUF1493 family protein [Sphingobacteriaceae bacterium]
MVYSIDDIIHFLIEYSGEKTIIPTANIFLDLGLTGDDFHEFIEKYTEIFAVDMSDYLWYFHSDEEGSWNSIGGFFFDPPYKRVERIPVTPQLLTEIANKGKWDIKYPIHVLPARRYDIIINQVFAGMILIWIIHLAISSF